MHHYMQWSSDDHCSRNNYTSNDYARMISTPQHNGSSMISVLLVDKDKYCPCPHAHQCVRSLVEMLQLYLYKVTVEPSAAKALKMLEKGKETFHLVIANMDPFDDHTFKLLRTAPILGFPTLMITDHEDRDGALARVALQEGAFLCLEKPISAVKILWQHVLRENIRRGPRVIIINKLHVNNDNDTDNDNDNDNDNNNNNNNNNNGSSNNKNNNKNKKKNRRHEAANRENGNARKGQVLWTEELHGLFMDTVRKLGEGRCFPKDIAEAMNVPNLTRMQVASHLQKCRNNDWNSPDAKKIADSEDQSCNKRLTTPRFGSMPLCEQELNDTNLNVDDFLVDDFSETPFYKEKI